MVEVSFRHALTWANNAFRNADVDGVFGPEDMEDIRAALAVFAKQRVTQATAAKDAEIEALKATLGSAYEAIKRIEQCADEKQVRLVAKEACGKIDAALKDSQP